MEAKEVEVETSITPHEGGEPESQNVILKLFEKDGKIGERVIISKQHPNIIKNDDTVYYFSTTEKSLTILDSQNKFLSDKMDIEKIRFGEAEIVLNESIDRQNRQMT
jgi:hypothetical protein